MASSVTSNVTEYSVSEISQAVKRTIEGEFAYVRVRGELGRVSRPGSGHVYLDLKDEKAVLSGVIWKGVAAGLSIQPEQGLEVVVTGRLTTFPGQSRYQIVIEAIEPAGLGALMALLEERKKKLAAEGLFDPARKQLLPYLPRVIGVVTSPTGAVIRDILHRLEDRFPVHVLVWPVRVQGETSARELARGIAGFNALPEGGAIPHPDVLIVARGGGSLEDLWSFNEEIVVRAAAASDIPLISAVGHETDWTLIDYAADERAPTPTAAAERAVPVRADLLATVADLKRRHDIAIARRFEDAKVRLRAAERGLPRIADLLALPRQRLDMLAERLPVAGQGGVARYRARFREAAAATRPQALRRMVDDRRRRFLSLADRLSPDLLSRPIDVRRARLTEIAERADAAYLRRIRDARAEVSRLQQMMRALGYDNVLKRGFALVRGADGQLIRTAKAAPAGAALDIQFADGHVTAVVDGGGDNPPPRSTQRRSGAAKPDTQASLFGEEG